MIQPAPFESSRRAFLARSFVPAGLGVALALAMAGTVLVRPPGGGGAAGAPVAPAPLPAPALDPKASRQAAVDLAVRLGLSGIAGTAMRQVDGVAGRVVDTVEFHGADGRLTAEITSATDGRLVRFVDLTDQPAGGAPRLAATTVPAAARGLLAAVRLPVPPGEPVNTWDAGMDAWCVRWTRTIDGIAAPTDGLSVWVRPAGRLKALDDIESPVSPAPPQPLTVDAARAAVEAYLHRLGLDVLPSLTVGVPRLAWVLPNGFADPTEAQAPPALHLAWAVTFSYVPPGWSERHDVELDVDATTGALIAGTETA
ncbi:MAG TPA: hypothetical protein VMH24_07575 [Candidatus Sulfotelmatobacter sp.]|nr:hypothetical protein [Candidatus Sulfotelmatobacter sp.]